MDHACERAVIGACLVYPEGFDDICDILTADHFVSNKHRAIYKAIADTNKRGKGCDIVEVCGLLRDRGQLAVVGNTAYLTDCMNDLPASEQRRVRNYATRLIGLWKVRQLIAACQRIEAQGYGKVDDADAFADKAAQ